MNDELKQQITALSAEEFSDLTGWIIGEERPRRDAQPLVDQAALQVVEQVWEANPELRPQVGDCEQNAPAWVQPHGAHDAYPPQAVVTHNGHAWRNTLTVLNVWEPGADGPVATWQQIDTPPEPPLPAPGGDAPTEWEPGLRLEVDQLVTHGDTVYRVRQAHSTQAGWEPPTVPSLFEAV